MSQCRICNCVSDFDNQEGWLKTAYPTDTGFNEVYLCEYCTDNILARATGCDDVRWLLSKIKDNLTRIVSQIA